MNGLVFCSLIRTFADCMNKGHKETISIRFISTFFMVLAIAIFKPFGLEVWQWQAYVHLLAIFALGLFSCFLTEVILRYIVRMPRSYDRGVSYIISRNLWFQCLNTPLVSLLICLYRHFAMSSLVESNKLSLSNYIETLVIIAFLSFAVGLYWRFKFRSRYLAAELEETRLLNEQLKRAEGTNQHSQITLEGNTNEHVALDIADLLYIEAVGNYVKVCQLLNGGGTYYDAPCHDETDGRRATSLSYDSALPSCLYGQSRSSGTNLLKFSCHAAHHAPQSRCHPRFTQ